MGFIADEDSDLFERLRVEDEKKLLLEVIVCKMVLLFLIYSLFVSFHCYTYLSKANR